LWVAVTPRDDRWVADPEGFERDVHDFGMRLFELAAEREPASSTAAGGAER
jgi:hypothetical protein